MFSRWLDRKKSISREAVINGFMLYLGREPESEDAIQAHMNIQDEQELANVLKSSAEYSQKQFRANQHALVKISEMERHDENIAYFSSSTIKVVIFGNCQSLELAKLMQAMTGGVVAVTVETTRTVINQMQSGQFQLASLIEASDLIFVQNIGEILILIKQQFPESFYKVRRFPSINFFAYHPDLVYVSSNKQSAMIKGVTGEYQSAIALGGWLAGLSAKETISLFREDVFEALGYYSYWDYSKKLLMAASYRCDFDVANLFDKWCDQGCWLYSINHPKQLVLADVARRLLTNEQIDTLPGAEHFVVDSLAKGPVWPVYPEIGKQLGISGHYYFKRVEGLCPIEKPVLMVALDDYILESYAMFDRYGREDLSCERMQSIRYKNMKQFVGLSKSVTPLGGIKAHGKQTADNKMPQRGGPYVGLPDYQFWRRAIEHVSLQEVDPIVRTGFMLQRSDRVATAGSCFAQHISSSLHQRGFNYFITEKDDLISQEEASRRHYGLFSARYGNIYTTRQLVQLFDRAYGTFEPVDGCWLRSDGRLVDAFRPQVEPEGFATEEDLDRSRSKHFRAVRDMFEGLDVFVFTLGLTEAWCSRIDGAIYPLPPGVVAGESDTSRYEFVNLSVHEVIEDLELFIERLRGVNANAKIILTVSPVPLIATYEDRHVLVSTTLSKSLLRTAADELTRKISLVDYFPSYEIITGNYTYGKYFESDLRSINSDGVQHVMRLFFSHYVERPTLASTLDDELAREFIEVGNIICDEDAIDGGSLN